MKPVLQKSQQLIGDMDYDRDLVQLVDTDTVSGRDRVDKIVSTFDTDTIICYYSSCEQQTVKDIAGHLCTASAASSDQVDISCQFGQGRRRYYRAGTWLTGKGETGRPDSIHSHPTPT